ncbi:MAG: AAA family ATPase [Stenomitos frigidus ULC029]
MRISISGSAISGTQKPVALFFLPSGREFQNPVSITDCSTLNTGGAVLLLPVSVVYIRVPSGCTPAQLFVEALQALHRNLKFGRIGDLRKRVRATLKEYGVKLLIIDDAHYLKLKALRELVQIHELLKIPVVLSGTGELYDLLKSEWKQVHNSFLSFYPLPAMTIDQTASVVDTWLTSFLGWEEESDLLYEDVLKKLQEKTGGLTGPLNDTLQKMAVLALKQGLHRIDEKTIHEVLDGQMTAVTNAATN